MIPWLGARGAAVSSISTEIVLLVLAYIAAKKDMPVTLNFGTLWKTLFAGAVMTAVVYGLRDWSFQYMHNYNILILIPIGGVVYGGILLATKAVTKDILKMLKS